jgi:hypothetical protein
VVESLRDHGHNGSIAAGLNSLYANSVGASAILGEIAYRKAPRRTAWEEVNRDQKNEQGTT